MHFEKISRNGISITTCSGLTTRTNSPPPLKKKYIPLFNLSDMKIVVIFFPGLNSPIQSAVFSPLPTSQFSAS